ncbi:ABC-type uncharacterized transport system, permease component [Metamycoplasma arthritidis]|uniref:Sugar ABC transporter permease protein n=1 Tax=Metamycoplasma arthritidis (strain 158L3-1) TaxID=243272 RepID=B3PNE9_META1|nr:ABC transporter permease [Metamycoplasma arthritidis]ACF07551.1 sugar ABC transporter permease protein [Metamycoplasma arthritidis 158L3-1]VEU79059.1 ABC-type uncharacterized transport system, permease component [Metamycoplasma arthritidis]
MLPPGLANTVWNFALIYFAIFSISSIGGMFTEKSGTVNIGINGMMIIGAASYLVFADHLSTIFGSGSAAASSMYWQLLAVPFAAICAGLFALLHGFATIRLKSDHTISGFAINLLAVGIALILLHIYGHGSKVPHMSIQELSWRVTKDGHEWEIISFKIVLTITIIIASYIMLYKTKWGLRFRSIGENPQAADVAGINVNKYKWQGIVISGALAGVAGAFFAQGFPSSFKGEVNGYGFIALAIMIMGQWHVGIITAISFGFGFLYSFAYNTSSFVPALKSYSSLFIVLPYLLALIVVMITAKKSRAPAAAGLIYDKSKR